MFVAMGKLARDCDKVTFALSFVRSSCPPRGASFIDKEARRFCFQCYGDNTKRVLNNTVLVAFMKPPPSLPRYTLYFYRSLIYTRLFSVVTRANIRVFRKIYTCRFLFRSCEVRINRVQQRVLAFGWMVMYGSFVGVVYRLILFRVML